MRAADFIARFLVANGVDTCFMVTGGGAMHLNDAFGAESGLRKVYCHHEQAAAIAAEAYARIAGKPALVCVTTGPGGINALNGVFGAYTDSIPMIVVSGQVKRETLRAINPVPGLRQLGDQEADIVAIATPVTKRCELVDDPSEVPAVMTRAWLAATGGRPGPVWIDVPVDVQGADIAVDASSLRAPAPDALPPPSTPELDAVLDALTQADRPVILAGTGVRLAGAANGFLDLIERLGVPVTTAWTHDLIDSEHPLFAGRPGTIGTRAGNFVVQNADCVLVLGSRLNIRQISYNHASFAANARLIQVDVDAAELAKPFPRPHQTVHADLADFIPALAARATQRGLTPRHAGWLRWCQDIRGRYTPTAADYPQVDDAINPYHFIAALFEHLGAQDIVACGDATATIVPFQIARLRAGIRLFSNSGCASMGYDLPAAIGAAIANPAARIVCLAGDGSVMMNLQELQTIATLGLNIRIVVLDNGGYLSIRQTQHNFFGREAGSSIASGLGFPAFDRVAEAFGIRALRLHPTDWRDRLSDWLAGPGPALCSVPLDAAQEFQPRLKSRMVDGAIRTPALDDMFPFLDPDELEAVRRSAREAGQEAA